MSFFSSSIMTDRRPEDISFTPLMKDVRGYSLSKAKADLFAAFTLALLSLPQALAYSIVVGLPPATALFATIFGTAIGALLGSSRHLVIGPNNATVLLVQTALVSILSQFYPHVSGSTKIIVSLELVAALTLLIGSFQLIASFLKLGRLIQFVSYAVVIGYVLGSAFALVIWQLFPITGIVCPDSLETLYEKLGFWITHLSEAHIRTSTVGIGSLFLFFFFRKIIPGIPASLLMIIAVSSLVFLLGISEEAGGTVKLLGGTTFQLFPSFELPLLELRLLNILIPIAFAIAMVGMLEAHAIAKSIAANTGHEIRNNQEVFALGVSNFFLSFVGALPCSGSFSRSALNYESGARTRFSAIISSLFVFLFLLLFGSVIQYIPETALAALLVATAIRMVDTKQLFLCLKATHSDAFVLIVTFLSCIFLSLQIAFYVGVVLSILLYLRKAAVPRVVEYVVKEETGELEPVQENEERVYRPIRIIDVEGELFFGAVDLFQYATRAIAEDDLSSKVIILRLKHVHDFDATAALALKQFKDFLKKSGRYLVISSVPPPVFRVLKNSNLVEYIGKENIITLEDTSLHTAHQKALERAKELLGEPLTGS